jgi:murein L,D-transpeptidase YafK
VIAVLSALAAGAVLGGGAVYLSCSPAEPRAAEVPVPDNLAHPRVLVEKRAHRLSLYDGERLVKTWRVAVGGGAGDKVREGDKCTPEGEFFVCYKNPQSKYTLSLGLSYPNEEDAARGLRDGFITREQHDAIVAAAGGRSFDGNTWEALWKTPLGGEIMIHGKGEGRDTTLGCVAMDDEAIRELYRILPYGTPVKIVP